MVRSYHIFGFEFSTYWTMFFLGLAGIAILTIIRRKRYRLSIPGCIAFTFFMPVLGLTGAKILYVLENLKMVKMIGLKIGGLSFFGSVWLILLLMPVLGLLLKMRPLESLDCAAPGMAIMIGFLRVGCFFNGCCGGRTVRTVNGSFTYPTQMIESIGDFLILFLLLLWEGKDNHEGKLYPGFLILYGVLRFVVEFMRDTPKGIWGFANGNWYSLVSILIGIILLICESVNKALTKGKISLKGAR